MSEVYFQISSESNLDFQFTPESRHSPTPVSVSDTGRAKSPI
jgi:hypothetical protein